VQFDLAIKNGLVVTAANSFSADIGIVGEKIAAIDQGLHGKRLIDAGGKLVLPGAVDPHVHLEMPQGAVVSSDDFETGTIAAACGGTTTIIDFVEPEGDERLLEALVNRRAQADGRAVIDYGLHMTLVNARETTLAQVPDALQAGCSSFKTYTIYEGFYLEDNAMINALEAVHSAGGLVIVHAENRHIVKHLQDKFLAAGQVEPRFHPRSRPPIVEAEAVQRVLALAEVAGSPLYVVHISTRLGVEALQHARFRGQTAFGETCPQYLLLTDARYDQPGLEGAKFVCSPPLRPADNPPALWDGLAHGHLQTVGSDHCPFNYAEQKIRGGDTFTLIPNGMPGIEARLALLYTFGVGQGRLSLNRWVEVCCTDPAKIFGLYPKKGTLAPGADADIVIFDPQREVTLTQEVLHEQVDYTPYEGFNLRGYPDVTIARGQVLCQDGEFIGPKGYGRFLLRKPFSAS
jgi:dihydropyrimidinase